MNSKILFESILKESCSNLKESVILHFNLEDGTHKALSFSSEEEALDYMDSDEFPAGEWVGDYEIEVAGETEYKVLKLEDAERLEELVKEIQNHNEDSWYEWSKCAIEIGRKYLGDVARYGDGEYIPFEDLIDNCEPLAYYKTVNIDKMLNKRLASKGNLKESNLREGVNLGFREVDNARKYYQNKANDYYDAEDYTKSDENNTIAEFLWYLGKYLSYKLHKNITQELDMMKILYGVFTKPEDLIEKLEISSDSNTYIEASQPGYLEKLTKGNELFKEIYDKFVSVELPKIKKRLSKVQTSISKPSFDSERDEMKWIYKQAAKKSKVKILDSYTKSKKLWSVTLDTEDEYDADNFRDAIDDLLGENSGAHSFDDIIGLGSVHIGVTTAAGEERMHGGDAYEDLDPSIRDKYVVYCEPAEQYKQRREMDW
jgi:hypothetical protein